MKLPIPQIFAESAQTPCPAIVKVPERNFAQYEQEFYQSGADQAAVLRGIVARAGLELDTAATVLELGCGTGRVTQ
jgi:cyclopropane fatty-acyl-phospholipid synthase-like methyltransferase